MSIIRASLSLLNTARQVRRSISCDNLRPSKHKLFRIQSGDIFRYDLQLRSIVQCSTRARASTKHPDLLCIVQITGMKFYLLTSFQCGPMNPPYQFLATQRLYLLRNTTVFVYCVRRHCSLLWSEHGVRPHEPTVSVLGHPARAVLGTGWAVVDKCVFVGEKLFLLVCENYCHVGDACGVLRHVDPGGSGEWWRR
jgi:hypothetical protein